MVDEICSAVQNNFKYDNVHRSYSIVNWNLWWDRMPVWPSLLKFVARAL